MIDSIKLAGRYLFQNIFGVSSAEVKAAVDSEVHKGARFETLSFPSTGLSEYKLVQFYRPLSNGRTLAGLGADKNEDRAYIKAIFEYFERQAFFNFGFDLGFASTNGVGAHRFPFLARSAGLNELYERDGFLRHWYSQTPFQDFSGHHQKGIHYLSNLVRADGLSIRFKRTYLGHVPVTLCFLSKVSDTGFALGLSAGRGTAADLEKSFLEALINYFFGHEGQSETEQRARISGGQLRSLGDHRAYWLLGNAGLPDFVQRPLNLEKSERYRLAPAVLTSYRLGDGPIPVVGLKSPDLIDLEVGLPGSDTEALLRRSGLIFRPIHHPIP